MDIFNMTATQIGQKIQNREISCPEVVNYFFKNNKNKSNSYILFTEEYAYEKAKEIQEKIDKKQILSKLAGAIVSLKDNLCTKDITTTCASKMLLNFSPSYNATVFDKLENAGLILGGKLNMDEFAMGDTGKTSYFGACKNPWDINRTTGGSSSGCASSIASKEAITSLGSDTGGSTRQPSAFCSLTGLKPTYGLVSRYGLVSFAPDFDQIAPITKDAIDCANIMEIISGVDEKDNTTLSSKYLNFIDENFDIKNIKIGVCKNFLDYSKNEISTIVENAIKILENLGAKIQYIDIDIIQYGMPTYQILSSAMATSNMARYDGLNYGFKPKNSTNFDELCINSRTNSFGVEVKKRIVFGNLILQNKDKENSYYKMALNSKKYIKDKMLSALSEYDILLTPTTPTEPILLTEDVETDTFLVFANIIGIPAMSIPCGFTKNGLPVGMQLISKHLNDDLLLNTAIYFQKHTDFHLKTTKI